MLLIYHVEQQLKQVDQLILAEEKYKREQAKDDISDDFQLNLQDGMIIIRAIICHRRNGRKNDNY